MNDQPEPRKFPLGVRIAGLLWLGVGVLTLLAIVGIRIRDFNRLQVPFEERMLKVQDLVGIVASSVAMIVGYLTISGKLSSVREIAVISLIFSTSCCTCVGFDLWAPDFSGFSDMPRSEEQVAKAERVRLLVLLARQQLASFLIAGVLLMVCAGRYEEWYAEQQRLFKNQT